MLENVLEKIKLLFENINLTLILKLWNAFADHYWNSFNIKPLRVENFENVKNKCRNVRDGHFRFFPHSLDTRRNEFWELSRVGANSTKKKNHFVKNIEYFSVFPTI